MTSVKDVARAAGVSIETVSTVISRPDLVDDATRDHVLTAIKALGFPSDDANSVDGPSRAVGLVVVDSDNPFFTTMARGAEDLVIERGDVVLLGNSGGELGRERRYLDLFLQQRVRGVLLSPTHHDPPDMRAFARLGIPAVYLDRHPDDEKHTSVFADDIAGGRLAGEHLVALGHRRVWFAGGPMSLQQVRDRLEGFRQVIAAAGGSVHYVNTQALSIAEGREAAERFDPDGADRPTGVFAANDLVAIGVLNGLLARGLSVPQSVSIIGYDNIDIAATTAVPLTSIHQPAYEMGREGARLLYARIDGVECAHRRVRFDPGLVTRNSTAPAPH